MFWVGISSPKLHSAPFNKALGLVLKNYILLKIWVYELTKNKLSCLAHAQGACRSLWIFSPVSHLRLHVLLCDVLSRCLWSWTSWPWTRTKRCSGRRRLDGSSLRKMWRRRRTAGGNLTWPRCPSAVCWSSERPSRTVRDGSEVDC